MSLSLKRPFDEQEDSGVCIVRSLPAPYVYLPDVPFASFYGITEGEIWFKNEANAVDYLFSQGMDAKEVLEQLTEL